MNNKVVKTVCST